MSKEQELKKRTRLEIRKETITDLDVQEADQIKGGTGTSTTALLTCAPTTDRDKTTTIIVKTSITCRC